MEIYHKFLKNSYAGLMDLRGPLYPKHSITEDEKRDRIFFWFMRPILSWSYNQPIST